MIALCLFLAIISIIIIITFVIIYLDVKNDYKYFSEGFKSVRDVQLAATKIDNKNDFKDYCIARLGTENIENLDMKNETKIKVIDDYLKGIEHMKSLATSYKIAINRTPLYGKLSKNNKTNDFTNFRSFL